MAIVQKTQGFNTWTFPADTRRFRPDEYLITATSSLPQTSQNVTATTIFNIVEYPQTATGIVPRFGVARP